MHKYLVILSLLFFGISCTENAPGLIVKTASELEEAITNAQPGDEIILANGSWKDLQIKFEGNGTEQKPITLRAETPGEVFIEGQSDLKFGGSYLVAQGLFFRNGFTPSRAVIEFRISDDKLANHCRVTNCVIEDYNQMQRDRDDLWVMFWGRHNQMDHCYLTGKSNRGPTVRVSIEGNESIKNEHQIVYNYFGPRPRKGGPSAETIQLGNSFTSMSPSNTIVANNLFDRCNGEVEVISSKTNFNEFRNNVFFKCEGSLVTRHGNYCKIDGNYFIGDENSNQMGGIRIINTGHWVTNNYFFNLKGESFRSPLAVMNGIPKSPLNRYNQVTDVVVAHNTWVNCKSPWQFGVGTNISQKDVLPPSEIRSARPLRTLVANNLIYNESGDANPIVAHDEVDGVSFKNNLIQNQNVSFEKYEGLNERAIEMTKVADYIYAPTSGLADEACYPGFDFETIKNDLFGNARTQENWIGAISSAQVSNPDILNKSKYGTDWYPVDEKPMEQQTHHVSTSTEFISTVESSKSGDLILLAGGNYTISESIIIDRKVTIQSEDSTSPAQVRYTGPENSPAFELHPKGNLQIKNITLTGEKSQYAFASLKENMSSLYFLSVEDSEISDFQYVLKAYKETFADEISFVGTTIRNCQNGIELSEETNDKGDYNTEFLIVEDCQFDQVDKNVIDYYRGGYDESTIGGNLIVTNSTFTNCGGKEENGILLNTRGIINVDISNNVFKNNPVKLVALLWGAKNNTHADNQIINSGKLIVEENLKLTLLY